MDFGGDNSYDVQVIILLDLLSCNFNNYLSIDRSSLSQVRLFSTLPPPRRHLPSHQ